ncbi:hypothetical protein U1Q18_044807 [Sarracenia purpurea var. burkii]
MPFCHMHLPILAPPDVRIQKRSTRDRMTSSPFCRDRPSPRNPCALAKKAEWADIVPGHSRPEVATRSGEIRLTSVFPTGDSSHRSRALGAHLAHAAAIRAAHKWA